MKTTKELIIADITAKVKAKLASQKVELTLDQDANKLIASYYSLTDNVNSKYIGISSEIRAVITKINEAEKISNEMPNIIAKFQAAAKEIGINMDNIEEIRDMKLAIKDVVQYKEFRKKLETLIK